MFPPQPPEAAESADSVSFEYISALVTPFPSDVTCVMGATPLPARERGWHQFAKPGSAAVPERLGQLLAGGRTFVLLGRNSGSGSKARSAAVADLRGAVALLASATGIDFAPLLPPDAELERQLKDARSEISIDPSGKAVSHRFAILDHSWVNVVFVVATGSGSKLTDAGVQPFIEKVASVYRRHGGALLVCKRFDRPGRQTWALAPLMIALEETDSWIFDEDGLSPFDETRALLAFIKGMGNRRLADTIVAQTRREQANRSDREMVGGRASYHAAPPPPPGFACCWLKGAGVTPTERLLHLDTGACRPADSLVAYGLTEVRELEGPNQGERVDQVENVRFVLRNLGRPGWSQYRLADVLTTRQASTEHFRKINGPAAFVSTRESARTYINSIVDNLEVYATGLLVRKLGGGFSVEMSGCFPPDGPWATPADFDRIRSWRAQNIASCNRDACLAFVGVEATFEGSPVRLFSHRRDDGSLVYGFALLSDTSRVVVPQRGAFFSPSEFANSVAEGIATAGEAVLRRFTPDIGDTDGGSELARLGADRTRLLSSLRAHEKELAAMLARAVETDPTGEPVLSGALLQAVTAQYNRLEESIIPMERQQLRDLENKIADMTEAAPSSVEAGLLLHLVASLRDVGDITYRTMWKHSVHNLRFTFERIRQSGRTGKRISWTGAVRVGSGDTVVLIPFRGVHEYGAAFTAPVDVDRDRCEELIDELARGIPCAATSGRSARRTRAAAAHQLGVNARNVIFSCDDPTLLRIHTALVLHPERPSADHARLLAVAPELVERVRSFQEGSPARPWRNSGDRTAVALYASAAMAGSTSATAVGELAGVSVGQVYNVAARARRWSARWTTSGKEGYELGRCGCGSRVALPMVISEPVGAVCIGCRRDHAGLLWPAEQYDRYVAHPEIWEAAGHDLKELVLP